MASLSLPRQDITLESQGEEVEKMIREINRGKINRGCGEQ